MIFLFHIIRDQEKVVTEVKVKFLMCFIHNLCSAELAHYFLDERLHIFGVVACVLCLVGSTTIVLHAPHVTQVSLVKQVWFFSTEPGSMVYTGIVLVIFGVLIYCYVPLYGRTHLIIYIGICSFMGSLSVMCLKAAGIDVKLSSSGSNQIKYFQTWFFILLLIVFCVMQLNYLNKALDTFNINVVFTSIPSHVYKPHHPG